MHACIKKKKGKRLVNITVEGFTEIRMVMWQGSCKKCGKGVTHIFDNWEMVQRRQMRAPIDLCSRCLEELTGIKPAVSSNGEDPKTNIYRL